jgi:N-acetylglucosamine kinase-like BadF-type ATPase
LSRAVGVESASDLVAWSLEATPRQIAALAHEVAHAAAEDDPVARSLVTQAAHDLADHIEALLPRLGAADQLSVALAGGLVAEGSTVRDALIGMLAATHPHLMILTQPVDPAVGALRLAAQLA